MERKDSDLHMSNHVKKDKKKTEDWKANSKVVMAVSKGEEIDQRDNNE